MVDSRAFSDLVSALIRLRQSLDDVSLPLASDGAEQARTARSTMVSQLEDYVLPRLLQIDAPLLAVVGGSTGAGKSTLVNSLVGAPVSLTGVLRPTTHSPVLVHHPRDASWFQADRILPDLQRTSPDSQEHGLQLVAAEGVPPGLALLDAPDVDSVNRTNRHLAEELLAAADLWVFVTSAARYADQVPWQVLADAARRSTAVAVVLDRTAPDHVSEVRGHLARMLTARGLKDSPLFDVPEAHLVDGLLPAEAVAPIRAWLVQLASNTSARGLVVERSLIGTLRSLVYSAHQVADAVAVQADAVERLRSDVEAVYSESIDATTTEVADGALLRGPVLTRWQELAAGGDPERWAQGRGAGLRIRLSSVVRSRTRSAARLEEAVVEAVAASLVDTATRAAEQVFSRWREGSPGLVPDGDGAVARARATRGLRSRASQQATHWQEGALAEVRTALAADDSDSERETGIAAMVQVLALAGSRTDDRAGAEAGPAEDTRAAVVAQVTDLLGRAIDGDPSAMVARVASDLRARAGEVLAGERATRLAAVESLGSGVDDVERIRTAARAVDDMRPSGDGA